ncbi:MEKHLA domain-containing protein [Paenibacillus sp. YIM B09110]|uniref:MEKHLA domain-containing protein n=1 Tax=Paenibacillus sp. YIM B09110 TaxID=3126102 RepID=UPI00301BC59E
MNDSLRTGVGATEAHALLLMDSYLRWTGRELVDRESLSGMTSAADLLFQAPRVILSHGTEADPVLNFGNALALKLWEMEWDKLTSIPSRLTAEPLEREERDRFFTLVTANGYVDDYTGVRISSSGRRFYMKQATVWNLIDEAGVYRGQAATFTDYSYIE